jgi:hypothetical protein
MSDIRAEYQYEIAIIRARIMERGVQALLALGYASALEIEIAARVLIDCAAIRNEAEAKRPGRPQPKSNTLPSPQTVEATA